MLLFLTYVLLFVNYFFKKDNQKITKVGGYAPKYEIEYSKKILTENLFYFQWVKPSKVGGYAPKYPHFYLLIFTLGGYAPKSANKTPRLL